MRWDGERYGSITPPDGKPQSPWFPAAHNLLLTPGLPVGDITGRDPQVSTGDLPDAGAPFAIGKVYVARHTPAPEAPQKRRSEVIWYTDGQVAKLTAPWTGQTLHYIGYVTGELAGAVGSDDWQLLWQAHGPSGSRGWHPPPLSLAVDARGLVVTGGEGHPTYGWQGGWSVPLVPWTDGRVYKVELKIIVSPDPAVASVSAWVDDVQLVNNYKPVARNGQAVGTCYSDHEYLESRSGLYRGTMNPPGRVIDQWVAWRVLRAK